MQRVDDLSALSSHMQYWRQQKESIAFVPTMGNLHDGHLSLIRVAKERADRVVASIFVNPLQFNDKHDLQHYPRTLDDDIRQLSEVDCDLVFTPTTELMYPSGEQQQTQIHVPGMDDKLCGLGRPGHFDGVATVVTKLFNMVRPDMAVFGEKDYQQLLLIRKLVTDLNLAIDIIAAPTQRGEQGLALSSRNSRLETPQQLLASHIYQQLVQLKQAVEQGQKDYLALTQAATNNLQQEGFKVEYVEIRRATDLAVAEPLVDKQLRILIAAKLGEVRLIDNIACNLA